MLRRAFCKILGVIPFAGTSLLARQRRPPIGVSQAIDSLDATALRWENGGGISRNFRWISFKGDGSEKKTDKP